MSRINEGEKYICEFPKRAGGSGRPVKGSYGKQPRSSSRKNQIRKVLEIGMAYPALDGTMCSKAASSVEWMLYSINRGGTANVVLRPCFCRGEGFFIL